MASIASQTVSEDSLGTTTSQELGTTEEATSTDGPITTEASTSTEEPTAEPETIFGRETQTFKICANVDFMFPEQPTVTLRYQEAIRLGFKGVECGDPYRMAAEEIAKVQGVETVLINTQIGDRSKGQVGFASLPAYEGDFFMRLQNAINYATTLNCKTIHIMAGLNIHDPMEHDRVYVGNLKKAALQLEDARIVGVIEPINHHSVPNYYLNDYDKAVSVINAVGSDHLGLLLDIFHLQQIKGNLTRNIRKYLPYTKHIQVAQVPDRHDPDTDGEINYPYIFRLLNELNYQGWVGLEYRPAEKHEDKLAWIRKYGLIL